MHFSNYKQKLSLQISNRMYIFIVYIYLIIIHWHYFLAGESFINLIIFPFTYLYIIRRFDFYFFHYHTTHSLYGFITFSWSASIK